MDPSARALVGVLVFLDAGMLPAVTDSAGKFRLNAAPPGRHVLNVRHAGHAPRSFNLEVPPAGALELGVIGLQLGPDPVGTIRGAVLGARGQEPLPGASILLNGGPIAVSDSVGRFETTNTPVQWGLNRLSVTYSSLTNAEVTDFFWVTNPGDIIDFSILLDVAPLPLPAITVEAPSSTVRLPERLRGFYERRERTNGEFLTREEIEARNPRRMEDLISGGTRGNRNRAASSFGNSQSDACWGAQLLYVDGFLLGPQTMEAINERLRPEEVEAIEMYVGVVSVPAQFSQLGSECGVVVVWTR